MFWPSVACVLLPWLLVYLGLHVVQRGIIFIDIAMAQMASLGICLGVLLVFSYLIVPAVCGINLANRTGYRLLIGWVIALIGGVGGLFLSFWWDLPSGAAIVCTFGALLIFVSIYALIRTRSHATGSA